MLKQTSGSQTTELATNHLTTPGASPPPVYASQLAANIPQTQSYPPSNYTELDLNTARQSLPPVSPNSPGASSMSHPTSPTPAPSELSGQQAGYSAYDPNRRSPGPQELNGTGGIARRPVGQDAARATDMSGAPMSENYPHELA